MAYTLNNFIHSIEPLKEYLYVGTTIFGGTILGQFFANRNTKQKNKFDKRVILWEKLFKESNQIRYYIEQLRFDLKFKNKNSLEDIFAPTDIKTKILVIERDEKFLLGLGIGFDVISMYMPQKDFENYFILSKHSSEFKEPKYFFKSLGSRYKIFYKNIKNFANNQNKLLLIAINKYYLLKEKPNLNKEDIKNAINLLDEINSYLFDFTMIFRYFLIGTGKSL